MPLELSPILSAEPRGFGEGFSMKSVDLHGLGELASPVVIADDFRVSTQPFPPHPHAGFSAVTYVMRDSPGALRSRVSLGGDVAVGAGGIVWTEAGSGLLHQEVPANPARELHGLQLFVNLTAKNKMTTPRMLYLDGSEVPAWRDGNFSFVRVVVGAFGNVSSPLTPVEPFDFLDIDLRGALPIDVAAGRYGFVYVVAGSVLLTFDGRERALTGGQALTMHGGDGRIVLSPSDEAQVIYLSGLEMNDPVVSDGPFIMNDREQVAAAMHRYRTGAMGRLAPVVA